MLWFSIYIATSDLKLVIISGKITIVIYITFVREEAQTVNGTKAEDAHCKPSKRQLEFLQKTIDEIIRVTKLSEQEVENATTLEEIKYVKCV